MTARRSWRTAASSIDFAGPARRLARWLAQHDTRRFCAPERAPPGKGRHLTVDERGYMNMLATDHLCRHSNTSPVGPCIAEPCQGRGAALALIEIIEFEDDERSDHLSAARDLHVSLEGFSRSLEHAEADLNTYLSRASQRHKGLWKNERSHDHKTTCVDPARFRMLVARWREIAATFQGRSVLSQFRSVTALARFGEGRRPGLLSTVEAILRADGWKLREILAVVAAIGPDDGVYPLEFEKLKKRLATAHKVEEAARAKMRALSEPPTVAGAAAPPAAPPSRGDQRASDGVLNGAVSDGEVQAPVPASDDLATGKATG